MRLQREWDDALTVRYMVTFDNPFLAGRTFVLGINKQTHEFHPNDRTAERAAAWIMQYRLTHRVWPDQGSFDHDH